MAQTVSRAVIHLRTHRKLTQGALAALAGVSRQTVNEIESGQRKTLRVTTLVAIAHALAVRPEGLLGYAPHPALSAAVIPLLLPARLPLSKP